MARPDRRELPSVRTARPTVAAAVAVAAFATAALVAAACNGAPAASAGAAAPAAVLDPVSSPDWARDMERFAADDAAKPPPAHPVVFTGSSSIRMWTTLAEDFPGVPVLNRGFGGSQLRDAVWYADQLVVRYRPRLVVLYAGDNDLNAGRSPQHVLADFRAFVARVRRDLPDTPIAYLSIKPSPSRAHLMPAMREANALIRAEAGRMERVAFIDVFTPMLGPDGQPRPDLFLEDHLHMNRAGYQLWRELVAPALR
jgi:lysophospholipase L1-like esterase